MFPDSLAKCLFNSSLTFPIYMYWLIKLYFSMNMLIAWQNVYPTVLSLFPSMLYVLTDWSNFISQCITLHYACLTRKVDISAMVVCCMYIDWLIKLYCSMHNIALCKFDTKGWHIHSGGFQAHGPQEPILGWPSHIHNMDKCFTKEHHMDILSSQLPLESSLLGKWTKAPWDLLTGME